MSNLLDTCTTSSIPSSCHAKFNHAPPADDIQLLPLRHYAVLGANSAVSQGRNTCASWPLVELTALDGRTLVACPENLGPHPKCIVHSLGSQTSSMAYEGICIKVICLVQANERTIFGCESTCLPKISSKRWSSSIWYLLRYANRSSVPKTLAIFTSWS